MTDDNADNTHTRMPALPKPMLRSLFETPLEADTLRWMGDLLLLGSAIAWLALAMGMLLLQMQAPPALPWLESVAGSVILIVGWRFYSRRWVASAPVLIHTSTVFAFVVYALTQPFSLTLGQVWIVAWACAAASITTLAFGYLNSLFFVVSGSLVLNLIFQWFHPSADHPTLANLIGLAFASVVALITHGACFQLTRASSNARQLERLRSDMLVAFSTELSVPGNALDNLAHRPDLDEQVSAKLGVIGHQLNALAGFLANEARSAAPQT